MNFADETYYTNIYLSGRAAVITTAFDYYARCATQTIQRYIGAGIDEDKISDEVRNCCCELAEACYRDDVAENNHGIASESVGGWSRSYESSDARKAADDRLTRDIVYKWLSGTGLLYRGVR